MPVRIGKALSLNVSSLSANTEVLFSSSLEVYKLILVMVILEPSYVQHQIDTVVI